MNQPDPIPELVQLMHRLRTDCPWDAEQTHTSLVTYLTEETHELIEAIEAGNDAELLEELGDVLLQVIFHAEIAAERGAFDLDQVAAGLITKLIQRHPYVFEESAVPEDLVGSWEQRKRAEKGRRSALDGIPAMPAVPRAQKIIARARAHEILDRVQTQDICDRAASAYRSDPSTSEAVTAETVGQELMALLVRAQAAGVDAEQALRAQTRKLEAAIRRAEST